MLVLNLIKMSWLLWKPGPDAKMLTYIGPTLAIASTSKSSEYGRLFSASQTTEVSNTFATTSLESTGLGVWQFPAFSFLRNWIA